MSPYQRRWQGESQACLKPVAILQRHKRFKAEVAQRALSVNLVAVDTQHLRHLIDEVRLQQYPAILRRGAQQRGPQRRRCMTGWRAILIGQQGKQRRAGNFRVELAPLADVERHRANLGCL